MIDCIFTGDIMPGAKAVTARPDQELIGEFRGADLVVGNLECPIVREPPAVRDTRKLPRWSDAANLPIIGSFGFTHVSLNNNHIFDLFEKGLDETQGFLNNAGIGAFGIDRGALSQYRRVSVKGIALGMVAVNWVERQFCGHLSRDLGDLDVGSLKRDCDFLIMFLHWGDDHNIFINRDQQEAARRLIDQGVDLVIGHHPHVTQGYETYRGKHIFYSLGNFIFTPREEYESLPYGIRYEDCRENVLFQRPECKIGLYVKVTFDRAGYEVTGVCPVYREETLPAALPDRLVPFFDDMLERMNGQVEASAYELNEAGRRMILTRYTLPLILTHPLYWPVFFRKLSVGKAVSFVKQGRMKRPWKK